ncbi:MAG: PorV/PorQ family protein [bacterium]|nr:PorV/PorQ family protein [bacterium]
MYRNQIFRSIAVILVLILINLPVNVFSQIPAYLVLEKEVSARASGLAGSFNMISGDPYALFYNPAGLIGVPNKTIGFTYVNDLLDLNAGNFVYTGSWDVTTKYAGGVHFINYGDFTGRDEFGNNTGDFTVNEILMTAGIAREFSANIYWGVSGKYLYSNIESFTSSVFLGDVGVVYLIPTENLSFGVNFSNFGFVASPYIDNKEDLPTSIKTGVSKKLEHAPVLLTMEYRAFLTGEDQILGGTEFYFSDTFTGRIGYNSYGKDQSIGDDSGFLAGVSMGFGFKYKKYIIDYAFSSYGVLGNQNRLGIVWTFE